jgi:hypothetical protein
LTTDETAFEVIGLDPHDLRLLKEAESKINWPALFPVAVDIASVPMAGSYRVTDQVVRFEPRFPLQPGIPYHAALWPREVQLVSVRTPIHADFTIRKAQTPPTSVAQIYPTANLLPENLLKFYIHFSAPMSRGEAYEHIKLLDAAGKPIEGAFLELGEELWDPAGKRFTLLFDPGRIKHGLKPREDLGPVLEAGKSYTLVIGKGWHDANGEPLKAQFRKPFKVGPQFDKPVDPKSWKIQAPAGKNELLVVTLPKPHDHALLLREVWVIDAEGQKVAGTATVSDEETCWQFAPEAAWKPGKYRLVAKTTLEDLAGNKVGRLFEVDEFGPVQKEVKAETIELTFEVKSPTR